MPLILADPDNPNEDPWVLFLYGAQHGSINIMEKAMSRDPQVLFMYDSMEGKYALHVAAERPNAVDAVRWLLKKGIPWSVKDGEDNLPEALAKVYENEESWMVLRNWAIGFEYELYYRSNREKDNPDDKTPFRGVLRLDKERRNKEFCNSAIVYINPAPDEVALVSSCATGVMMEWERPIMRETARRLLDGMPTTGLRVLNIGFGIGMIDTYFQDAQPAEHVIIEGHPTCLGWMRRKGWYDRPGVRILEGRWQEFFPCPEAHTNQTVNDSLTTLRQNLLRSGQLPNEDNMVDIGKFDVVYFDTFEEGYRGHFAFIKNVPGLLRGPGSRFSYFNGHGAQGDVEYQIYKEVAGMHHNDLGMNTESFLVHVDKKTIWYNLEDRDKGGMTRSPPFIPICTLAPTVPRRVVPNVGWNSKNFKQPPAHFLSSTNSN